MLAERLITYTEQAVIEERKKAEQVVIEERKKAEQIATKRIVINCFNKGMDINEIADLTDLTIEQINKIKENS